MIEMATELVYELNADDDWITDHFEELVDKYEGRWVAVVDEEVAAVGDSAVEVEEIALKKNPNKLPSVILIPHKEDFECLLFL
jgi:hypothetical protein